MKFPAVAGRFARGMRRVRGECSHRVRRREMPRVPLVDGDTRSISLAHVRTDGQASPTSVARRSWARDSTTTGGGGVASRGPRALGATSIQKVLILWSWDKTQGNRPPRTGDRRRRSARQPSTPVARPFSLSYSALPPPRPSYLFRLLISTMFV